MILAIAKQGIACGIIVVIILCAKEASASVGISRYTKSRLWLIEDAIACGLLLIVVVCAAEKIVASIGIVCSAAKDTTDWLSERICILLVVDPIAAKCTAVWLLAILILVLEQTSWSSALSTEQWLWLIRIIASSKSAAEKASRRCILVLSLVIVRTKAVAAESPKLPRGLTERRSGVVGLIIVLEQAVVVVGALPKSTRSGRCPKAGSGAGWAKQRFVLLAESTPTGVIPKAALAKPSCPSRSECGRCIGRRAER